MMVVTIILSLYHRSSFLVLSPVECKLPESRVLVCFVYYTVAVLLNE